MAQVVIGIIIIVLYVMAIMWFFKHALPVLLQIGCIVVAAATLFSYLKAIWYVLGPEQPVVDVPVGKEPAYRQYFFRKAFLDYREIVIHSVALDTIMVRWLIKTGTQLFTNPAFLLTWPLGVTFALVAGTCVIVGAIFHVVLGIVHLTIVLAIAALVLATGLFFWALESVFVLVSGIFVACPHAGCYKRIALPVYLCPKCGAQHRKLKPGRYGTFRRRCICGNKLPTLFLFGRNQLPSQCPHASCGRPLTSATGVTKSVYLPIAGGPSAGKTSFLMACVSEIQGLAASRRLSIGFPEDKDKLFFESCRKAFETGSLVFKTTQLAPDAFVVELRNSLDGSRLVHAYDAAGELFESSDSLHGHEYYSYINGIVFVIDPLSLEQLRSELRAGGDPASSRSMPSSEAPQFVYDRMVQQLRSHLGVRGQISTLPIAVVVTKTDVLGIAGRIEGETSSGAQKGRHTGSSGAVRAWLVASGEGNLVRGVENDFRHVRYFHCSALGRAPSTDTARFEPRGVLGPLGWLLGRNHFHGLPGGPGLGFPGQLARVLRRVSAPVAAAAMVAAMVASGFGMWSLAASRLGVVEAWAPPGQSFQLTDSQSRPIWNTGSTGVWDLHWLWLTRPFEAAYQQARSANQSHLWMILSPGRYRLSVHNGPYVTTDMREFDVQAGRVASVDMRVALARAVWRIRSVPRARVLIDGNELGMTPLEVREVPYGTHTLSLLLRGRVPLRLNINVEDSGLHEYSYRLTRGRWEDEPGWAVRQAVVPGTLLATPLTDRPASRTTTAPAGVAPVGVAPVSDGGGTTEAASGTESPGEATTVAEGGGEVGSDGTGAPHVVRARITNVDDIGALYVNGLEVLRTAWGQGPGGKPLGHEPGRTDWIDITEHCRPGVNEVRLWVFNVAGCCGVSSTFDVQVDGVGVVHEAFTVESSTGGVKFDQRRSFEFPGN
ncbi:MAG: PEGA domain-containing protein [Candidatus Eisenbacteria bacterium]|uniref:PEGA domain-containing protein n=1 Tax=Eiseniibacteriota bacterium TaxID=2212470 RepID=A0A933SFR0_UNCEI|nr:PEGA domain-containing protein [Candidatus Eisenbacteria bacterium]